MVRALDQTEVVVGVLGGRCVSRLVHLTGLIGVLLGASAISVVVERGR